MGYPRYQSWGRYPRATQEVVAPYWRSEPLPLHGHEGKAVLPFGNGRSYGDVCLNDGGVLLACRGLDRFIHFDPTQGLLRCEAGVLLSEILKLVVPQGWFLPVTPGTQFVTVGGAIANDIHGKNHHRAGTFGCHVRCFELLRSDGTRFLASPIENRDWFGATIGGLGLTGVITWAEIQLKRIANPYIDQDTIRYGNLDDFFSLSRDSDTTFDYTVAWVDCLAKGRDLGRGLFIRGNHAKDAGERPRKTSTVHVTFPVDPPFALVNGLSIKLFNTLYYRKQRKSQVSNKTHYVPFFYPLDAIYAWNRLYGSRGFLQYQCVVPSAHAASAVREILERIAAARTGSFLAVLKVFGDVASPGLLSFPRAGATLALDFPNQGQKTFALLDRLDEVTRAANGAVYPAKDSRMSAASFKTYYPQWQALEPFIDPQFSSSFWRRVTGVAACPTC
ncbi:MAG TPA: FAD-binding oxidoreductase [Candidatus Entotheonella sp.]